MIPSTVRKSCTTSSLPSACPEFHLRRFGLKGRNRLWVKCSNKLLKTYEHRSITDESGSFNTFRSYKKIARANRDVYHTDFGGETLSTVLMQNAWEDYVSRPLTYLAPTWSPLSIRTSVPFLYEKGLHISPPALKFSTQPTLAGPNETCPVLSEKPHSPRSNESFDSMERNSGGIGERRVRRIRFCIRSDG